MSDSALSTVLKERKGRGGNSQDYLETLAFYRNSATHTHVGTHAPLSAKKPQGSLNLKLHT